MCVKNFELDTRFVRLRVVNKNVGMAQASWGCPTGPRSARLVLQDR